MRLYNKKGVGLAFNVIIYAVAGIVFLAMFIGILIVFKDDFNKETVVQTICWATNSIKCGGGLFVALPSCTLETLEEPIDETQFASLLRATYWMYKQGECDFGVQEDQVYPVYSFQLSEDINLGEFLNSLTQRKDGEIIKNLDIKYSDLAYLEDGTYYQTLCFDTNDKEGISNKKLVKGKLYYIIYYDDASQLVAGILSSREKSDAILISDDPTFDKEWFEQFLANTPISLTVVPAIFANYVLEKTNEERGCLVYNVQGGNLNV